MSKIEVLAINIANEAVLNNADFHLIEVNDDSNDDDSGSDDEAECYKNEEAQQTQGVHETRSLAKN